MGLFSKKRKVSAEEMALDMMHVATATVGKLKAFNDVDDLRSMAVSLGYFYGFLRLNLACAASLATANTVIAKSINNLEEAVKGKPEFANFGSTVRTIAKDATENMRYAMKELGKDPFMGMAVFYLKDLYNTTALDISKMDVAESNMRFLYGQTSNITSNIKIVN